MEVVYSHYLGGEKYTRVYTIVYPRVYNSVHACTLPRSKYVPERALESVILGAKPRRSRGAAKPPKPRYNTPKEAQGASILKEITP